MRRTPNSHLSVSLLSMLVTASVTLAGAESVPLTTTDALNELVDQNAARLQETMRDLEAMVATKAPLLDECAERYKAQPTRDNFARFYVVHFSLVGDESRLLSELAGIATKLALCMQEDGRRKRAFGALKARQLAELQSKLERMRERYQALSAALEAEKTSDEQRAAVERRRVALRRLIETEWRTKVEIEKSVARAKTSAEKATGDLGTLSVLGEGVRARRDVSLAGLRCAWEKLQRGQALSPDPSVEKSRDGLNDMLGLASQIRSSLERRSTLEVEDAPSAGGQTGNLQDQIKHFLGETAPTEATRTLEGKDGK